jgi:hypothetical protein
VTRRRNRLMPPGAFRAWPTSTDDNLLEGSHRIADISYRAEWIRCTCGLIVTAPPDALEHDRHEPLVGAWSEHRLAVLRAKLERRRARRETAA